MFDNNCFKLMKCVFEIPQSSCLQKHHKKITLVGKYCGVVRNPEVNCLPSLIQLGAEIIAKSLYTLEKSCNEKKLHSTNNYFKLRGVY